MKRIAAYSIAVSFALVCAVGVSAFADPMVGKPAPEIDVKEWLNSEKPIVLKDLRGKVVVLEFWASSSPLVDQTVTLLNQLHELYKDKGVVILAVTEEPKDTVKPFVEAKGIQYIVGVEAGPSAGFYGVTGLPSVFVIDAAGDIQWAGRPSDGLGDAIKKQVAASKPTEAETGAEPEVAEPTAENAETEAARVAEEKAAAAQAAAAKAEAAAAKAEAKLAQEDKPEEVFVIADKGWRDPFTDPRVTEVDPLDEGPLFVDVVDEVRKDWENARDSMVLEGIIGWENDLTAIIGGVKVRPGDILAADKLKFKVERVSKDDIELKCISDEEKYIQLKDQKIKKALRL